ncbi:MAG: 7-cyano-7-deazaguanine synthase QueC [Candidatus Omnitrophica bacterium]|nr:7-cyano-7-deazaguanine synthase QueC [Candidatus Omnitrophota bacterium]
MSERTPSGKRQAVVLLSGGLDSATVLAVAQEQGFTTTCLSFDYGQRHRRELAAARCIAAAAGSRWHCLKMPLPWKGSALLDRSRRIPKNRVITEEIPATYVPARNIIFLSFAVSLAEAIGAQAVFIGANQIDYSGYPDCRAAFLRAFGRAAAAGTKCGAQGRAVAIRAPLLRKNKAQIVRLAARLGVPFALTWSCYEGGRRPCGVCDSCALRRQGFSAAGIQDPAL